MKESVMIKKTLEIFKRRYYVTERLKNIAELDLKKEEGNYNISTTITSKVNKNKDVCEIRYFGYEHNSRYLEEDSLISPLSSQKTKQILDSLYNFEVSEKFITPSIKLNSLAKDLNTNSKYLSRAINLYKQKTFTQYINDLRIDYLIERLKTDNRYRNYTIKAIATEIGFNTPNAFSRAFYKKMGVYPSEYIKEIDS